LIFGIVGTNVCVVLYFNRWISDFYLELTLFVICCAYDVFTCLDFYYGKLKGGLYINQKLKGGLCVNLFDISVIAILCQTNM